MTNKIMQYRKFGKLDWKVSALSLGTAELPRLKEDDAIKVIRTAIDLGVNLLDVGWPPADTQNESFSNILNKALADGYREKIKIAVNIPAPEIKIYPDFERALEKLLKQLNTDSIDFLLFGGLNRFTWPRLKYTHIGKSMKSALEDNQVKYFGFFFHDQFQFLRDITRMNESWSLCQFQYSFMDNDHHPGYIGLKYAADNGLGVIVNKPLLGGRLLKNIRGPVAKVWENAQPKRSPAEWALRWVWNHREVSTVVCDMASVQQVKENAALADTAEADGFSVPEELVISKARDAYQSLRPIPCTACRGCMPSGGNCPQGIDVPRVFEIYNDAHMYHDIENARFTYRTEHHDLSVCNECGACICGKKIPIPDWLKKARALLGNNG